MKALRVKPRSQWGKLTFALLGDEVRTLELGDDGLVHDQTTNREFNVATITVNKDGKTMTMIGNDNVACTYQQRGDGAPDFRAFVVAVNAAQGVAAREGSSDPATGDGAASTNARKSPVAPPPLQDFKLSDFLKRVRDEHVVPSLSQSVDCEKVAQLLSTRGIETRDAFHSLPEKALRAVVSPGRRESSSVSKAIWNVLNPADSQGFATDDVLQLALFAHRTTPLFERFRYVVADTRTQRNSPLLAYLAESDLYRLASTLQEQGIRYCEQFKGMPLGQIDQMGLNVVERELVVATAHFEENVEAIMLTDAEFEGRLAQFIGLRSVKDRLRRLRNSVEEARKEGGAPPPPCMGLLGNPGCGKSKFGVLIAEMLYGLGVIRSPKVVKVEPSELR